MTYGGEDSGLNHVAHGAFMAYVGDDASHAALRAFVTEIGLPPSVIQPGDIDTLTNVITTADVLPKVILVDLDGHADPLPALSRLIEALDGISKIIAVGSKNDVNLFRGLLAAGAADYVVKPLTPSLLHAAFKNAEKLLADEKAAEPAQPARIIPIIGVRGGVGASTLAVNLGWLLAHRFGNSAALFDLDLQYGTSTLALDLVPGRGLREALETPGRLDSLLIASSMVSESDKFSILGAEEPLEDQLHFDASASLAITNDLKNNFQFILIDLPRHLVGSQKRLLAEATTIILVAEQTLVAIRDLVRLKNTLRQLAPKAKLLYVVSRVLAGKQPDRAPQIDRGSFEKGLGEKINFVIPEDSLPVALAANRGQPLGKVASSAPITKAIGAIAESLTGRKPMLSKMGLWDKLTSKFRLAQKKKVSHE